MTALRPFSDDHKLRFCAALRVDANFGKACEAVGFSRGTVTRHIESDADFAAAVEEAREDAIDTIEAEIRRRAVEGVDEPVFYQGMECGAVRKYSDTLIMFLAKKLSPAFREKSTVDLNVNDDVANKILAARARSGGAG